MFDFIQQPLPVSDWVTKGTDWLTDTFSGLFSVLQQVGQSIMDTMTGFLGVIPPILFIVLVTIAAFFIGQKKWTLPTFTFFGLLFVYNQGLWDGLLSTITLVIISSLVSIVIGVPLGILMAKSNKAKSVITPILDFMQTMPGFVYLIPAVAFFGIGMVPGVFASVIFALPPTVRMTNLGIRQVPTELVEASDSFGGTGVQKLFKLELPLAKGNIFAGINQTIMLALSMVVIASMIGAPGLGQGVLSAVQRSQIGSGFVNGLALVILAIIMDRFTQNMNHPKKNKKVKTVEEKKKSKKIALGVGLAAVLLIVGIGVQQTTSEETTSKGTVNLAYVEWDTEVASTTVVSEILRDMGYEVNMTPLDNAIMWEAVANGEADGMVAAWLPNTHAPQYEKFKDQVEDLGPNLDGGAKLGIVVPDYMDVDSIEDLEDQANKEIIGIEPGAGVVAAAEETVKSYPNLSDWKVTSSSSGAMTTQLGNAVKKEEPIVITGWSPHWMFSRYDLKYLEDPKGTMGDEESIKTMVRPDLKEDMPEVYQVLDRFSWEVEDIESVMLEIENGTDPVKAARDWIDDNEDKVQSFTKGAKKENTKGNSIGEKVDYTITGIEPGAGLTDAAGQALEDYDNLSGWNVQESSTAGMLAELEKAIKNKEPLVVTGWTPHWMFEKFDLKMLEDPQKSFGEADEYHTLARKGLKKDQPEAYQIIDNFEFELDDIQGVIAKSVDEPYEKVAQDWINDNPEKVATWTDGVDDVEGEAIEMVSTSWDTEQSASNIIKLVLEQKGYDVTITTVEPAIMYQSIASNQADFSVNPCLPMTQAAMYEPYANDIDDLGANFVGDQNALVVPSYVAIDSIEDLPKK